MSNITQIIKAYAHPESIVESRDYLRRYYMSTYETDTLVREIMNKVFINGFYIFPKKVFKEGFAIIPSVGGLLMACEDFEFIYYNESGSTPSTVGKRVCFPGDNG